MDVVPPRWVTRSAAGLVAIGLLAALWRRRGTRSPWWRAPDIFGLPALALLAAGSIANSYWVDYQPQGRYLLPCVPALVLQIVGGIITPAARAAATPLTRPALVRRRWPWSAHSS
jgi:peptidoglycan/LPS O-acetylase OafA/YrhL